MSEESLQKALHEFWFPFLESFDENRDYVYHYKTPKDLKKEFDFSLRPSKKASGESLEKILAKVVEFTPNAWSPKFLSYLYSSPDPVGLIGDWFVSLLNSNVHAYEASPVFALAEIELIKALAKVVGFGRNNGGIFCPGGSYSNMLAMHLARNRLFPDAAEHGFRKGEKPVVFASEQSHYSIEKSAVILGLGTNSIVKIGCDKRGRMIPDDLKRAIEKAEADGRKPFFVNATLGTTVLGAFDQLPEILDVLSGRNIWLHVDAAWGGAVLMSEKFRTAAAHVEHADSITWDLHKALRSPLLCSALLVKKGTELKNVIPVDASYLFHGDEAEEDYNLGEVSPQCGRRGDAFKFWLMWKVHGKEHFSQQVEERFSWTNEAIKMIKSRKCFWIYDDHPDFWNVCFWYVPPHLRDLNGVDELSEDQKLELEQITRSIHRCLKKDGQALLNIARIGDYPSFIRFIAGNKLNHEQLERILDIVESIGRIQTSTMQQVLVSGGDSRLHLDNDGLNYILVSPTPAPVNLVSRSSCTGTHVSAKNYDYLTKLLADIRSAKVSFRECMEGVHERIRGILKVDSATGIVTVPSGTDAEYIPLLLARAYAGCDRKIINIVTAAEEIGTHSATAAEGLYYTNIVPSGAEIETGKRVGEIGRNIKTIPIAQGDGAGGIHSQNSGVWVEHVRQGLSRPKTVVLLHIVDSSKLGRRMDVIDKVESMLMEYPGRILVTIDSCQSRTDISRTRHYLRLGYIVMITGSKFEEGPPFSGAVIVPHQITDSVNAMNFENLLPGLGNFITRYDVSGSLGIISRYLPSWMNWGLMMRWACALNNWEEYRNIDDGKRNQMIQGWVEGVLKLVQQHPDLEVLDGGEIQPGAVGDSNTIISLKLMFRANPLPMTTLKKIHRWLYEDMSDRFRNFNGLSEKEKSVLKRSFLIGKPVDLGAFAVLRIALGAKLACFMDKQGVEKALADDADLLLKLSVLTRNFESLDISSS